MAFQHGTAQACQQLPFGLRFRLLDQRIEGLLDGEPGSKQGGKLTGDACQIAGTQADAAAIVEAVADALAEYAGPDGVKVPASINLFSAVRR